MTSKSSSNTDEALKPDKPPFEEAPFKCWLSFQSRAPNCSPITLANNKTTLRKGDLFVIILNEEGNKRLLMEVDEERPGVHQRAEVTIDDTIKKTFNLPGTMPTYYMMQKVANKEPFALYLVELQLKEQYFSRGDMWRFTRKLVNTTVYLRKPLEIFGMRASVYGLWIDKEPYRVSSGYITSDTKIVFRSLSACCTIFLQMSKEMWDFDHHGDTYYEKAVDGFLFDLFTRWKAMSCQHDVTMTLFSRIFYDAKALTDFPESVRQCITKDHRDRFYEDFYRVIYQNERYDDWLPRLAKIKQVLVNYKEDLITYHKRQLPKAEADKMPKGTISCAADGNFLETLNLSSSVFERHFIDRPFDRLGQMSVVITPGAGVFEVDRELTIMTKQRVLDNGIGSDLVCLGEQPLFAVPLFKYFKQNQNTADDYQIPHWMNLSYYHSSSAPSCFKRYIPRLPFDTNRIKGGMLEYKTVMNSIPEDIFIKLPHLSMDDYDEQVFRASTKSSTKKDGYTEKINRADGRNVRKRNITMGPSHQPLIEEEETLAEANGMLIVNKKTHLMAGINDDPRHFNVNVKDDIVLSTSHAAPASMAANLQFQNTFNQSSHYLLFINPQSFSRAAAQSADTFFLSSNRLARTQPKPKALTNPFAPASIRIPMVPSRRRWAHTFPMGPNKLPWHFHHLRQNESAMKQEMIANIQTCAHLVLSGTSKRIVNGMITKRMNQHSKTNSDLSTRQKRIVSPSSFEKKREVMERKYSTTDDSRTTTNGFVAKKSNAESSVRPSALKKEKKEAIIWGPTGVEPWSASMITGIDWKSLTIPASLPITFDVVPSDEDMERDYTHNPYLLFHFLSSQFERERKKKSLPNGSESEQNLTIDPMERQKVTFDELIDQRLSQGFQMVSTMPNYVYSKMIENIRRSGYKATEYNRLLSIGRIYHTLSLVTEENRTLDTVLIYVQQHKPQHVFQPKTVEYNYRFQCPDSPNYDPAHHALQLESLESFPWNLVDNVVCNHGSGEHKLADTMKYWRIRLVLMPVSRDYTIRNIELGQTRCDSRQEMSKEDFFLYIEHFVRFLFMLNKLVRARSVNNDCIHRPIDPSTNMKKLEYCSKRTSKTPLKMFKLADVLAEDVNATNNLINLFCDDHQGFSFVKDDAKDNLLPEYSFIAIEAIWWSIEHCEDIGNEGKAMSLFQRLFQRQLIRHCTGSVDEFRFGFFLYYIVTDKTKNFRLEANDYAEVEFHRTKAYIPSMDYLGFGKCQPMRLLPKLVPNPQASSRLMRSSAPTVAVITGSSETSDDTQITKKSEPIIEIKRNCNVDVDPKGVSDRREWATAHYHAFYNPHCLFELEIRWLVATACILGNLITNWSQRTQTILNASQVAFHLVPIPCDPFADFDALRGPIYIEMNLSCLRGKLADFPEKEQVRKLSIFQELILKRYGFILNSCVSYTNENIYYVHISGGMLVYIISDVYNEHRHRRPLRVASQTVSDGSLSPLNCGFYWCWNFCLGKKWRSSQTGEEKYQDIMLADFRALCANENNRLFDFWDEVNQMAEKEMNEKREIECEDDDESLSSNI